MLLPFLFTESGVYSPIVKKSRSIATPLISKTIRKHFRMVLLKGINYPNEEVPTHLVVLFKFNSEYRSQLIHSRGGGRL